ncbi:unnamed protein product [Urochloa decumbens]|uniref:DNA damage-binding protein CMR1 n=1 Tax=Urochloa decumbens TaxID=240449 RepID=A0ABC9FR72_9POAL
MAETPGSVPEAVTEYERRRQENIRRNQAILAELRHDAAAVSAAYAPARPKKQPRANPPAAGPAAAPRRSGRARRQPPPSASVSGSLPSEHLKRRAVRFPISEAFIGEAATVADPSAPLISAIRAASWPAQEGKVRAGDGLSLGNEPVWRLKPENVRKVKPTVISAAPRVLPLVDRTVVAVGTDFGHLMFWDADCTVPARTPLCPGSDGMFWYHPHSVAVSGITVHPSAPLKIYSCSRHGEICLMDVEEEVFNMVHLCNDLVLSLCQSPDNSNCLYFGKGNGDLKGFDERAGKISSTWQLHRDSISSIDFNPENTYMLATSSLDNTACVWDLRNMKRLKAQSLKVVEHKLRVHSAYFSPSGSILATTSSDNTVGVLSVRDFDKSCYLQHSCPSTTFKANWGWNDSELFVDIERDIGILSFDLNDISISASYKARIGSEEMSQVPNQFATHPYQVGVLACAGRNKLFLWTPQ